MDTIQEHLQERASIAQTVRIGFVAERVRSSEIGIGEPNTGKASFQKIREGREQFVQYSSNSADARRLAELDRYAAQTREDVYRAFELLDVQRHDLELVRAHHDKRVQKEDILERVTQFQPEMVKAAEAVRLPSTLHQQISISTAQPQAEHAGIWSKEPILASLSRHVPSDREWHFDSLREVLNVELNRLQSGDRGHEISKHSQMDDLTRDH